ncbi:MAG TPA: nicotinate-nucleotide diphosphorylase (carboxylating), partial [Propionibacteriaceae bacterium]|nr:nicotinate-nucleotide diphosphorylase (carboxylating) [Propionibacteriaceae bacterium]
MRSLPSLVIEPLVRAALLEDLGRAGDVTTDSIFDADDVSTVQLVVRDPGVVAGVDCALLAWRLVDPSITVSVAKPDGSRVVPGDVIATITGHTRGLLTGERVALNFLGHLSGVATGTARIADAIAHTSAHVADT